jgi:hypothetical protein
MMRRIMESAAIDVGQSYGFRRGRALGQPFVKVKVLDKVGRGGKVKIRWEEGPHPGLEEYISTRQIVVRWGERRRLLRDEEREQRIEQHLRDHGDRVVAQAASAVLASSGEMGAHVGDLGYLCMDEGELQRIADRAGVTDPLDRLHPLGFRDRLGQIHLPLEAAESLARSFAAAEPETVMMFVQGREDELRARGWAPGERYLHDLLRDYLPSFSIAKQWAGLEGQAEALRKEIARLRTLVSRSAYELKAAGKERKAQALLRALDGR